MRPDHVFNLTVVQGFEAGPPDWLLDPQGDPAALTPDAFIEYTLRRLATCNSGTCQFTFRYDPYSRG